MKIICKNFAGRQVMPFGSIAVYVTYYRKTKWVNAEYLCGINPEKFKRDLEDRGCTEIKIFPPSQYKESVEYENQLVAKYGR